MARLRLRRQPLPEPALDLLGGRQLPLQLRPHLVRVRVRVRVKVRVRVRVRDRVRVKVRVRVT